MSNAARCSLVYPALSVAADARHQLRNHGGATGGAVAAALIPAPGLQVVFLVGAAAPLGVALLILLAPPELRSPTISERHDRLRVRRP